MCIHITNSLAVQEKLTQYFKATPVKENYLSIRYKN